MSKPHCLDPSRKRTFHKEFIFTLLACVHRWLNSLGLSFPFKQVRYHQQYQREIKGMAGPATGAEGTLTKEYVDQYGQVCDKMTSSDTALFDGQFSVCNPIVCDTACDHLIKGWAMAYFCPIYESWIF